MREIIGSEYADRRDKSRNNFNSPLRDFSEESCFGGVWADDTLPRKTRSLLCLVMLTALGRTTEFRIHVGAALNNGCTAEEIRSTLLQATIYCGLPAGNGTNDLPAIAGQEDPCVQGRRDVAVFADGH